MGYYILFGNVRSWMNFNQWELSICLLLLKCQRSRLIDSDQCRVKYRYFLSLSIEWTNSFLTAALKGWGDISTAPTLSKYKSPFSQDLHGTSSTWIFVSTYAIDFSQKYQHWPVIPKNRPSGGKQPPSCLSNEVQEISPGRWTKRVHTYTQKLVSDFSTESIFWTWGDILA